MANKQLFLNNFVSVFVAAVKNAATTGTPATELDYGILRLSNGAAGQLVNPTAGDYYVLTAFKKSGSVESAVEIMNVTAVDNSVVNECRITVTRAQETTAVQAYVAGDYISLRLTQVGAANWTQTNDTRLLAQANLTTHLADFVNPHSTTKAQVGLSIVDNVASATLLARANHTGTQLSATVSDFAATVLAGVLTGLSLATTTAVAATDSVLIAFGKLQAQVTANLSRANQTGTQLAATISDFAATVLGGVLTGLSLATATAATATDTILVAIGKLQAQATSAVTALALRVVLTSTTGSAVVPAGTTAQRDAAPIAGYLRWNQTLAAFEGYSGAVWSLLAGAASGANNDITSLAILSGYLFGCQLSTAGASTTMSITAGKAQDSTGVQLMTLTAIAKTTSTWLLGTAAGGLDTGAIANNTWYHYYVIRRPDTGVVDVLFSLSATAPTLPASYTQFRRIGSGKTNGSAQWVKFSQNGDEFLWDAAVADVVAFTGSTAIQQSTISAPPGIKTNAIITAGAITGAGAVCRGYVYSPDVNSGNTLASLSNFNFGLLATSSNQAWSQLNIRTNTLSQVFFSIDNSTGIVYINTHGWIDARGRTA